MWTALFLFVTLTVTEAGTAAPSRATPPKLPKSFAVFTASYNTHNDLVRGGVNGTVFFVSPTHAITAHHVLRKESFRPLPGFERVRVWLVHENYKPIEMKAEWMQSNPDKDVTVIRLPKNLQIDKRFVYATGRVQSVSDPVETDGFVANTDGPVLRRQGLDINIVSVPRLQRLHLVGQVVRTATVNLKAADIDLKGSPNVELSYKPIVGISGGPVTSRGKVIAMNSFADPGTFKHTWALQLKSTPLGVNIP